MKIETQELPSGKIKWRQHETVFVTATSLIVLACYAWNMYHLPADQYANPFIETHTPFSMYKNILFPDLLVGLSAYLAYLYLSLYTIPRLVFSKTVKGGILKTGISFLKILPTKKMLKKYAWIFAQLIAIIFILGSVFNIATYYRHQWLFNYPGFSILFNKNNPKSQMDLSGSFFAAASVVGLFGLYICVREVIINSIMKSGQREYCIAVCNKVTAFVAVFIALYVFLQSFGIIHEQQFFINYILVGSAIFAMVISNVYWLFPMIGNDHFISKKIITRLLSTSFVYAIPLVVLVHEQAPVAFLYGWALQLFIVTPCTWWYYQSNKDKILQLRVVEKKLVKSTADLQFLRSQINPHFLFNVLNTLYGTALQEKADRTSEGIQKLGDMMRFMLHENNLDFIQMDKETAYLKNYIALQKLRTQSSPYILIEDNISEQNCHHRIAPMLLIPLVENAFKHGISLKERSWIIINLHCTSESILFEVRNSVHAKDNNDPEKERSGIGYKNVLERLKLIYPGKFQIDLNGDEKEYAVRLSIQP